jgi:hypothetical protein
MNFLHFKKKLKSGGATWSMKPFGKFLKFLLQIWLIPLMAAHHMRKLQKHWSRLSINKNFPYSHTTSLSCKCCYFMQTHQKHLHKTQNLDVHFKRFEKKKSIKRFFMHTQPKKKKKFKS